MSFYTSKFLLSSGSLKSFRIDDMLQDVNIHLNHFSSSWTLVVHRLVLFCARLSWPTSGLVKRGTFTSGTRIRSEEKLHTHGESRKHRNMYKPDIYENYNENTAFTHFSVLTGSDTHLCHVCAAQERPLARHSQLQAGVGADHCHLRPSGSVFHVDLCTSPVLPWCVWNEFCGCT